jgi:MFS family permease
MKKSGSLIFYGWVVVAVGFVTLGIAFGVWYSFSVFMLAVIDQFGWTLASTSSIFSIFILCHALFGLITGHLQDRLGPRIVIPMGTLILTIALVLTSRAHELWHFRLFYGVMAGIGVSLLGFGSHAAFIPRWFERKRGLAVGIAMSGIGFGMLFLIPLIERGITAFGWRSTYIYLGGLVLLVAAPMNAILSRRSPQDMNLHPDGDEGPGIPERNIPRMTVRTIDKDWAHVDWTLLRAIKTRRFWFLLLGFFCLSYAYQGILLHSISAMVHGGMARERAAIYFGILGISGSAGKILLGYLSDLYGRERINTLGGALAGAGIICLVGVNSGYEHLAVVFALCFGLGYGAAAPLLPTVCADIFLGRSFGLIFSMISIGGGAGGASGSFMAGYLHDISGSYFFSFCACFTSLVISCTFIWLAGPSKVRRLVKTNPS